MWGPLEVVRSDNESEFINSVMTAMYQAFGVEVPRVSVRHPQSQGMAERLNRTLLTLARKTLEEADDWKTAIDLLLVFLPCSSTYCNKAVSHGTYGWVGAKQPIAPDA